MNEPTFTKGPWASDAWGCVVKGETLIANCRNSASGMRVKSPHEDEANARLIAAAPELLAQCKLFEKVLSAIGEMGYEDKINLDSYAWLDRTIELREILAKVEGEK